MKVQVLNGAYHRWVDNVHAQVKNGRSIKTEVVGGRMACGAIEGGPDDPAWRYEWPHRPMPLERAAEQVPPCTSCFPDEAAA